MKEGRRLSTTWGVRLKVTFWGDTVVDLVTGEEPSTALRELYVGLGAARRDGLEKQTSKLRLTD